MELTRAVLLVAIATLGITAVLPALIELAARPLR